MRSADFLERILPILLITFLKFFWRLQKILGRRRDDLVARRRRDLRARNVARFPIKVQHSFWVRAEATERTLLFCKVSNDRLAARASGRKGSRPNTGQNWRDVKKPPRILCFRTEDGTIARDEYTLASWGVRFRCAKTTVLLRRTPRNR